MCQEKEIEKGKLKESKKDKANEGRRREKTKIEECSVHM
jgi:hypothetical protein